MIGSTPAGAARTGRHPRARAAWLITAVVFATAPPAAAQGLPPSSLAVWSGDAWRRWWSSASVPAEWLAPHPVVASAADWREAAPGVEWAELRLAGSGEAWRVRAVLVRLEPRRLRFRLDERASRGYTRGEWTIADAPEEAILALNTGQFAGGVPWGWVVRGGREVRRPGRGPLSMALVVDTAGDVRLLPVDGIEPARASGAVAEAFQSYPLLLDGDGVVPLPLRETGRGVDLAHRDARLAVGELRDGRLLLVLTRFDGLRGTLDALPFGPTIPEMAALMGALGARRAMLLDGGISAQMRVGTGSAAREWRGMRKVPLGLYAVPASSAPHDVRARAAADARASAGVGAGVILVAP